jgi:Short C-terminal domain
MGALDRGGTSFNLPMTLQVYVEGMSPYEVRDQWMVKNHGHAATDAEARLRKLAGLRDGGLITPQEYEEKKDQILKKR